MVESETEPVLHWTCPSCGVEWRDPGRGFAGSRFSKCLGCGAEAREEEDAQTRPGREQRFITPVSAARISLRRARR